MVSSNQNMAGRGSLQFYKLAHDIPSYAATFLLILSLFLLPYSSLKPYRKGHVGLKEKSQIYPSIILQFARNAVDLSPQQAELAQEFQARLNKANCPYLNIESFSASGEAAPRGNPWILAGQRNESVARIISNPGSSIRIPGGEDKQAAAGYSRVTCAPYL